MFVIDRFEGGFAVAEMPDGSYRNIPLSLLPEGIAEGDCVSQNEKGLLTIDRESTTTRREDAKKRFDNLFKKEKE